MARPTVKTVIDLDDAACKRRLLAQVGALRGQYRVRLEPAGPQRSGRQNAWYFGCICQALCDYLQEQEPEAVEIEACHRILASHCLGYTVLRDPRTGRPLGRVPKSTAGLSTEEFSQYTERCRAWLASMFGIEVPDPDANYVREKHSRGNGVKP